MSADFWNRTLQNWQSEFLAVLSMASAEPSPERVVMTIPTPSPSRTARSDSRPSDAESAHCRSSITTSTGRSRAARPR
ncbi:DUF6766 family protein [Streptosporangium sp. NPDC048865]|uniref:DUF6766 family protein n=1 Tax=Streptosporangium sp. NPDC048865 TaxID=3155766 RepID=UPI00341D0FBD